ncbi:Putative nuclease HARBI1 [Linum perenne]
MYQPALLLCCPAAPNFSDFQHLLHPEPGALDGTHVKIRARIVDQPRYRNRKGEVSINVLGVCNLEGEFIYCLSGWEGSAHDARVLRDALSRPLGLKVPTGSYFLCDAGYANCEGFLTPFRGQRYHLKEWGNNRPNTPEEYYNMKHSSARNVIEPIMSRKKNSGYFPWNDELDRVLVKCMRNLVDEKKIDPKGKFIAGAYIVLEQMMEHEKPGCKVKADPNIISRVKTLKGKFLAMQELRGLSGAGWDDVAKSVDIEDTVYDEYVANHAHCAKMNRVPFPLYDGLAYVFGKGRATGKGVVGVEELESGCPGIEVPNNMHLGWNYTNSNIGTEPSEQPNINQEEERDVPSPMSGSVPPSEATNRPKRARRSNPTSGDDVSGLTPLIEDAVTSLRSMAQESDVVHKQRAMVFTEIGKIEGLTEDQVVDATLRLGKDDSLLEIFFNVTSDHARKRFIERILL